MPEMEENVARLGVEYVPLGSVLTDMSGNRYMVVQSGPSIFCLINPESGNRWREAMELDGENIGFMNMKGHSVHCITWTAVERLMNYVGDCDTLESICLPWEVCYAGNG